MSCCFLAAKHLSKGGCRCITYIIRILFRQTMLYFIVSLFFYCMVFLGVWMYIFRWPVTCHWTSARLHGKIWLSQATENHWRQISAGSGYPHVSGGPQSLWGIWKVCVTLLFRIQIGEMLVTWLISYILLCKTIRTSKQLTMCYILLFFIQEGTVYPCKCVLQM